MTGRSIAISVLAHAAVLAVVVRCDPDRRASVEEPAPQEIEIVEVPVSPAPAPVVAERPIHRSFDSGASRPRSGRTGGGAKRQAPVAIEAEELGDVPVPEAGSGSGDGSGGGSGSGIGGAGPPPLALSETPKAPSPRAAPPPRKSKARPARLIFPKKHREVEDGDVFVALLTVDDDGLVVGVRMKQGIGGRRDEVAAREVWRFRYDPARDDAGKPVRSKVEQRFMLDR